jgi:hypothetical protein
MRSGSCLGPCAGELAAAVSSYKGLRMHRYSGLCDDFYINMNLSTEMELPNNRETILHFFERVQKTFPSMRNFYVRDRGDFVLEEDKERGSYRWSTIEPRRVCSGHVNPESIDDALAQHRLVLDLAPYLLSVSPLDCEALDLLFGFDFTYRGNHNQLVSEALGLSPSLERIVEIEGATVISDEPSLTIALDEECRLQFRVSVETRTNAYHVRTGDYPEEQLSVYATARQYGSLSPDSTYVDTLARLSQVCHEMIDNHVVEQVLRPLARAIAMK